MAERELGERRREEGVGWRKSCSSTIQGKNRQEMIMQTLRKLTKVPTTLACVLHSSHSQSTSQQYSPRNTCTTCAKPAEWGSPSYPPK